MAKQKVAQVKESIERYKQFPHSHPGAPPPTHAQADCPPPYSTTFTQPYYPPTYQNTVAFVHGWPSRYVQFFYVLTPVHPRALRFIHSFIPTVRPNYLKKNDVPTLFTNIM